MLEAVLERQISAGKKSQEIVMDWTKINREMEI
jgi:hypothetical protein